MCEFDKLDKTFASDLYLIYTIHCYYVEEELKI